MDSIEATAAWHTGEVFLRIESEHEGVWCRRGTEQLVLDVGGARWPEPTLRFGRFSSFGSDKVVHAALEHTLVAANKA